MMSRCAALILGVAVILPSEAAAQDVIEYYGVDRVGSVRVIFDSTGALVGRHDYGPFGEQLAGSRFGNKVYAQLFRDGEIGEDYARARMFQVRAGRFSTVDPIFANVFAPQNLNRYAYALNSPLVFTDESGLCPACMGIVRTLDAAIPRFTDSTTVTPSSGGGRGFSSGGGVGQGQAAEYDDIGTSDNGGVLGGTFAGTAIGTTIATETQSQVDEIDNVKFGKHDPTIKRKLFQWQRTFHMDWHNKYGYHFNADWGPLKFANHWEVPHWVHAASTKTGFRAAAAGAGSAAVVIDVYNVATADNKCVAAAGAIGGVVGGAVGAWFGSAVPGPGTIAGGAAGGAAGGWAGEKLGTFVCR
jgi:RHS repeat-associated protein